MMRFDDSEVALHWEMTVVMNEKDVFCRLCYVWALAKAVISRSFISTSCGGRGLEMKMLNSLTLFVEDKVECIRPM